jgi:hypothetical protein
LLKAFLFSVVLMQFNTYLFAEAGFLKDMNLYLIGGHLYSSRPFTFHGNFTKIENTNFVSLGASVPFYARLRNIQFEAEADFVRFYGQKEYLSLNLFFVAKFLPFHPSLAVRVGSGFSFSEIVPPYEVREKGAYLEKLFFDAPTVNALYLYNQSLVYTNFQKERVVSNRILSFWMIELDYSLDKKTGVFVRVQQRSGTLGLYCRPEPGCGSGYVGTGLRLGF